MIKSIGAFIGTSRTTEPCHFNVWRASSACAARNASSTGAYAEDSTSTPFGQETRVASTTAARLSGVLYCPASPEVFTTAPTQTAVSNASPTTTAARDMHSL